MTVYIKIRHNVYVTHISREAYLKLFHLYSWRLSFKLCQKLVYLVICTKIDMFDKQVIDMCALCL